jgi:hypothetical protein
MKARQWSGLSSWCDGLMEGGCRRKFGGEEMHVNGTDIYGKRRARDRVCPRARKTERVGEWEGKSTDIYTPDFSQLAHN